MLEIDQKTERLIVDSWHIQIFMDVKQVAGDYS